MKTDISTAAPPPPSKVSRPDAPTLTGTLVSATVTQLQEEFDRILRAAQLSQQLTEVAEDGSTKLPSLVAVYLISQVGAAIGRPRFVDLARVPRSDLRSLAGVARLVHQTLHPAPAEHLAS